jgi:hypothetical protein
MGGNGSAARVIEEVKNRLRIVRTAPVKEDAK